MFINCVQSFRLNPINKNKVQNHSGAYGFKQNELMSDTVSFGNSDYYSITKFQDTWAIDNQFAGNILEKRKPKSNELKNVMNKMEEHFNGILDVLSTNPQKTPLNWYIDEAFLESNITYQMCAKKLQKKPNVLNKLNVKMENFLKSGHTVSVSPQFLINYSRTLNLDDDVIDRLTTINNETPDTLIKIKEMPDKINGVLSKFIKQKGGIPKSRLDEIPETFDDETSDNRDLANDADDVPKKAKSNKKIDIVDQAEKILTEQEQATNLARVKIDINKPETIKEGFEDLVKMNQIRDIKEALSDFVTGMHKLPNGMKLEVLIYNVGSMFMEQGKESALNSLIFDKKFPESLKKFLRGSRL